MSEILHRLFEVSAQNYPQQVAVSDKDIEVTYNTLNERANQLAHHLIEQGVQPETLVGIFCEPGIDFIVCMLGILKAGGAYVPMDTHYPTERIQYIVNEASLKLVLTQTAFSHMLPRHCHKILIDQQDLSFKTYSIANPEVIISPGNLAYVIYTSGSTGHPKGVMIEHRSIYQLIKNNNFLFLSERCAISQVINIVFDVSVFEIWIAFAHAALLICINFYTLLSPDRLEALIEQKRISVLSLPTGAFGQFANIKPDVFASLDTLIIAGDVLKPKAVMNLFSCQSGKPKNVINAYGPTENTVFSTTYYVKEVLPGQESIPIGKPVDGVGYYIFDDQLQPVLKGEIGELYLFGAGLARGYLNRPALTEERFIVYTHEGESERLYKTGDLVKELPDGNLDFIGRADRQVKIRGHRVELGEIEVKLNTHPTIQQAVVEMIQKDNSESTLVAYYIKKKTCSVVEQELRQALLKSLPDYMIPQFFISLETFPLTHNGKIDRKQLPYPAIDKVINDEGQYAYQTETEEKVVCLFGEVLSLESQYVNPDASFFDLGGHSLMLARLFMEVKAKFDQELNLSLFLENPTVHQLAKILEQSKLQKKTSENAQLALRDAELSSSIQPLPSMNPNYLRPKFVLLTGATGFLGAFLLHELLEQTNAIIYCIVRADDKNLARDRVIRNLKRYHCECAIERQHRIRVLCGNLGEHHLSLSDDDWQFLSQKIDAIYHNGAMVHHVYGYEQLRSTNVFSTMTLLELATTFKNKSLHYISTLSAVSEFDEDGIGLEKEPEFVPSIELSGYGLTKWVSERLLMQAFQRGVKTAIYRPGNITGDTCCGASNSEINHELRLIKSCVEFGVAPDWQMMIEMMPVDCLSRIIIKLSLQKKIIGNFLNLSNPCSISWTSYINKISQLTKKPIKIIDETKWKEGFLSTINEQNALFPFVMLYTADKGHEVTQFHSEKTQAILKEFSLGYSNNYDYLISLYVDYLKKINFL